MLASACASYRGTATDADPSVIAREAEWVRVPEFRGVRQRGGADCGSAALSSVLAYWGDAIGRERVEAELAAEPGPGLPAGALADLAKRRGLEAFVFRARVDDLKYELSRSRPVIVGLAKPHDSGETRAHYEVVIGLAPASHRVLTFDPARGFRQNTLEGFLREWGPTGRVALVMFERENHAAAVLSETAVARQNATGAQPKMQSLHNAATIGAD